MIRIAVAAPEKSGLFPYVVTGGPYEPLVGIAEDALMEALRILQHLGVRLGTRIEYINHASGEYAVIRLQNHLHLPNPEIGGDRTADRQGRDPPRLSPPTKTPRRARRKALIARSSGVPGDG